MKLKKKIPQKLQNLKKAKKQSLKPLDDSKSGAKKNLSVTEVTTELNSSQTVMTNIDTHDETFKKAVEESKEVVAQASQKPIKSGRGRKPLPRDAEGNIIRGDTTSQTITSGQNSASAQLGQTTSSLNAKEILVEPLIILSKIPARKHDIPELALSTEESEAVAGAIDKIFDAFFPDLEKLNPKTAALLFGAVTISAVTLSKAVIYSEVMQSREDSKKAPVKKETIETVMSDEQSVITPQQSAPMPRRNPMLVDSVF